MNRFTDNVYSNKPSFDWNSLDRFIHSRIMTSSQHTGNSYTVVQQEPEAADATASGRVEVWVSPHGTYCAFALPQRMVVPGSVDRPSNRASSVE